MTEITKTYGAADPLGAQAERLSPAISAFVLRWGELGTAWGVNRSVAQIHALLLMSDDPVTADYVANVLSLARSNVSNSLKELMTWKLIVKAPIFGDRRDHYVVAGDVWDMFEAIVSMRKARELDPASAALSDVLTSIENDASIGLKSRHRISELGKLINNFDSTYDQISKMPRAQLIQLVNLGARVYDLLGPFLKTNEQIAE